MEQQGNTNQEESMNDPMAGFMMTMARSASTDTIFNVFNVISTNFELITGRISQGGQFMWAIILQACHLLLKVARQMSMSMVNIIFDGGENRFHILKETLKESGKKILNIGQAVRQVFMNYWVNQEVPDLNVDLQDVLDPNVDLQETEPEGDLQETEPEKDLQETEPEEEHSNQSSSGQRTPNEEADISLDWIFIWMIE